MEDNEPDVIPEQAIVNAAVQKLRVGGELTQDEVDHLLWYIGWIRGVIGEFPWVPLQFGG